MKSEFVGPFLLAPNHDGKTFTVAADFTFVIQNGDSLDVTVKRGDTTDLASVPNLGLVGACIMLAGSLCSTFLTAWSAPLTWAGFVIALASHRFNRLGRHMRAAVVHDHCYCYKSWPRPICDGVFYAAMRADGVDLLTAAVMFVAVRLGGWKPFYAKRREQATRTSSTFPVVKGNQ